MTTSIDLTPPLGLADGETEPIDLSVVMPCLNEEESVALCVTKALEGIARTGLRGEVVVSDNGSTDASVDRARAAGARIVHQPLRGYGNAYMKGFAAARGRYIVMGDSDDTYDFTELSRLVAPLQQGNDYVLGSRLGGHIMKGAMPWTHRYIGNPILTSVLNRFFGLKSSDAHSGMRAFTRDAYDKMGLCCEGMEFASEIVIKAARANLNIAEVPITYHPRKGESKLHSVRDGWRHLRFMLLLSPTYLFVIPGLLLFAVGFLGESALLPGPLSIDHRSLDIHFSILFALLALVGAQTAIFGAFAKAYTCSVGLDTQDGFATWVLHEFSLERGLLTGLAFFLFGFVVDLFVLIDWIKHSMGPLNAVRPTVYALTLMVLGVQLIFASFFLSLFRVRVHAPVPDMAMSNAAS